MKCSLVFALIFAGLLAFASAEKLLPSFDIDLDADPKERWKVPYTALMSNDGAKMILSTLLAAGAQSLTAAGCDDACKTRVINKYKERFPEYYEELEGIAEVCQAAGVTIATADTLTLEQVRYEWTVLDIDMPTRKRGEPLVDDLLIPLYAIGCTSTLVCDPNNNVYHGRNLDWFQSPYFAQTMFHANYKKGGKVLFQSEQLMGLTGLLTASRIGAFTMSINAKVVDTNNTHNPDLAAFLDCFDAVDMQPIMTGFRYYAEHTEDYDTLLTNLTSTATCSPRYSIIGGAGGKGVRIQHNIPEDYSSYAVSQQQEPLSCTNESWYVAQCNSDFDVPAAWTGDVRRMLVMNEFNTMTRPYATTPTGLFRAMIVPLVRNERSVHTTVMSPESGVILTVAYDNAYPDMPTPVPPTPTPTPSCPEPSCPEPSCPTPVAASSTLFVSSFVLLAALLVLLF